MTQFCPSLNWTLRQIWKLWLQLKNVPWLDGKQGEEDNLCHWQQISPSPEAKTLPLAYSIDTQIYCIYNSKTYNPLETAWQDPETYIYQSCTFYLGNLKFLLGNSINIIHAISNSTFQKHSNTSNIHNSLRRVIRSNWFYLLVLVFPLYSL